MSTKYIFITGGVVSGLGKGIAAASIGALLEARGFKVTLQKFDPYINVDPGTMSPFQHGEVFVTDDGAETDLDLGHYERFTSMRASRKSNFTTGRIYLKVIEKERQRIPGPRPSRKARNRKRRAAPHVLHGIAGQRSPMRTTLLLLLLGLGCAVKWSGVYWLAAFAILTLVFDATARRAAGVRRPWVGALVRDVPPAVWVLALLPVLIYLGSWWAWFRSETGIAKGHVSVSSVAVDYVRQVFDHFGDKTILVIGAGKMGYVYEMNSETGKLI